MYAPAISGADALVPPAMPQHGSVSGVHVPVPNFANVATPVSGSATAATSTSVRLAQPWSVCHTGFVSNTEQPLLPLPLAFDQTVSDQPLGVALSRVSDVPP